MLPTLDLVRRYVSDHGFRIREDEDNRTLSFRFQLNSVVVVTYSDDPQFLVVTLPGVADVTEKNRAALLELCHSMTAGKKMIKAFIANSLVVLSSEFYFVSEDDFAPLFARALELLVSARGDFRKRTYDL
jgi:hypothetical protein